MKRRNNLLISESKEITYPGFGLKVIQWLELKEDTTDLVIVTSAHGKSPRVTRAKCSFLDSENARYYFDGYDRQAIEEKNGESTLQPWP